MARAPKLMQRLSLSRIGGCTALFLGALFFAAPAAGQGQAKPEAKKTEAGPRRDDKGIKGISPFGETVKKGDNADVARDFDGAISAYREAIQKQPQNPMGHYRIGEAHLAKGDDKEAEAAWVAGLRYVGKDHQLRTKLL